MYLYLFHNKSIFKEVLSAKFSIVGYNVSEPKDLDIV